MTQHADARPPLCEHLEPRMLLSAAQFPLLHHAVIVNSELQHTLDTERESPVKRQRLAISGARQAQLATTIRQPRVTVNQSAGLGDLRISFDGLSFDQNAGASGLFTSPPDPAVAAGPNHVISVVNNTVQWFTQSGQLQHTESLGSFFRSTGANPRGISDPRILYDPFAGRFMIGAYMVDGSRRISSLLLAFSRGPDPNSGWTFRSIRSRLLIGGHVSWADFPAIAVDSRAIYITANMFPFSDAPFTGTRLWIVDKATGRARMFDPSRAAGLRSQAFSLHPAEILGGSPNFTGAFLVSSGWSGARGTEMLNVIRISDPTGQPRFQNQFVRVGNVSSGYDVPWPSQPRSGMTLDPNDGRILSAVWRNNMLYVANTVNPPSGPNRGQATAHWYRLIAPTTGRMTLYDQGNIGGEDIAKDAATFNPAITADRHGNMAVGFAAAGPGLYPGAYYATRQSFDPRGSIRSSRLLAGGLDAYERDFGTNDNRWGDYSGIAIDPANNTTFWIFNQYAQRRGTWINGESGRWGTRIGAFSLV